LIVEERLKDVLKGGIVGDVEGVRSCGVGVGTFEGFVARERTSFRETYRALEA